MSATELLPLHVYLTDGKRYALLRGPARQLVDGTSVVAHWSHGDRGYLVRADRVPELLARAELQGCWHARVHRVEVAR